MLWLNILFTIIIVCLVAGVASYFSKRLPFVAEPYKEFINGAILFVTIVVVFMLFLQFFGVHTPIGLIRIAK